MPEGEEKIAGDLPEIGKGIVEQIAVLSDGAKIGDSSPSAKRRRHGSQLDDLGACPDDQKICRHSQTSFENFIKVGQIIARHG